MYINADDVGSKEIMSYVLDLELQARLFWTSWGGCWEANLSLLQTGLCFLNQLVISPDPWCYFFQYSLNEIELQNFPIPSLSPVPLISSTPYSQVDRLSLIALVLHIYEQEYKNSPLSPFFVDCKYMAREMASLHWVTNKWFILKEILFLSF